MTEVLPRLDEPGDAELISAVRGGDVSAYGSLFERHADAARRLARQLVGQADADDLVSDAFAKVLGVLQKGGGPDLAFRAYLLTAVRRLHVDKIRSNARLHSSDNMESFDPGVPFRDTAVEGFENAAAAKAFASLPERWQLVLWHTEVEGQKPADIAPLLGMSANSVSALAYRAREGLRQAFLNSHLQEIDDAECRWTHEHLGAYIRNGVSKRDAGKVEKHLDECRKCMAVYLELTEVNSGLAGILAPLLLGSAGAGYLTSTGAVAAKGGLLLFLDRAKDSVASNGTTAAVAGVAAATVVVGVAIAVVAGGGDPGRNTAEPNPVVTPKSTPTTEPLPTTEPPPPRVVAPPPSRSNVPAEVTSTPAPSEAPAPEAPGPVTSPPPASPPTSAPPVTTPPPAPIPPSTPPTTPPPPPPPTYNLSVAALDVTTQGALYRMSTTTEGYAPAGTGTMTVTWRGMELHKFPESCNVAGQSLVCEVSESNPAISAGDPVIFNGKGINILPEIEVTVAADNFTDSDPGDNTRTWGEAVSLLGLHVLQLGSR